jgi:hypothetical protein
VGNPAISFGVFPYGASTTGTEWVRRDPERTRRVPGGAVERVHPASGRLERSLRPSADAERGAHVFRMGTERIGRVVAMGQGAYWGATGLWPIVHLKSFEAVTGPKTEGWLVKTVGGLIFSVGATLLLAGARRRVTPEIALLGAASAAALGGAGGWYAWRGRIRSIYLADAAVEALLVGAWAVAAGRRRRAVRSEKIGVRSGIARRGARTAGAGPSLSA